jgi:hypothetical protein
MLSVLFRSGESSDGSCGTNGERVRPRRVASAGAVILRGGTFAVRALQFNPPRRRRLFTQRVAIGRNAAHNALASKLTAGRDSVAIFSVALVHSDRTRSKCAGSRFNSPSQQQFRWIGCREPPPVPNVNGRCAPRLEERRIVAHRRQYVEQGMASSLMSTWIKDLRPMRWQVPSAGGQRQDASYTAIGFSANSSIDTPLSQSQLGNRRVTDAGATSPTRTV